MGGARQYSGYGLHGTARAVPLARCSSTTGAANPAWQPARAKGQPRRPACRVRGWLVVEDQADNRQIIRDTLAPTDYEITEVESGEGR